MKALLKTLGLTLTLVGTAYAGDTICSSTLSKQRIDGDVVARGICTLNGTIVQGNVKVAEDATLIAKRATIDGNIQADKADAVTVIGGSVNGNIQVKQSTNVHITTVSVSGNIQLFDNQGTVRTHSNSIKGNLQCKGNKTIAGKSNRVKGKKQDQCKAF